MTTKENFNQQHRPTIKRKWVVRIACIAVLFGGAYTASTPPFKCTGSEDVCNVYDVDQYCGPAPGGYKRCIPCAHIQQSCGKSKMPLECYNHCIQLGVANALKLEKERRCSPVQDILHANHNGSTQANHTVGEIVSFICIHGYYMVGFDTMLCQKYGQWSSNIPRCYETVCPEPVTPKHGHVTVTSKQKLYNVASTIHFQCNSGYVLHGPSTASCGSDGRWNLTEIFSCEKGSVSLITAIITAIACCVLFICMVIVRKCICKRHSKIRKQMRKTRKEQCGIGHKGQNKTEKKEEGLKDFIPKNKTEQAIDIEMGVDNTDCRRSETMPKVKYRRINSSPVDETENTRPEESRKKLEQSQSFDGQNIAKPRLVANLTQSSGFGSCSTTVDEYGSSSDTLPNIKDGALVWKIKNLNYTIGDNNINNIASGKSTAQNIGLEKEMNQRNQDKQDASDDESDDDLIQPEQETGITVEPMQPAPVGGYESRVVDV